MTKIRISLDDPETRAIWNAAQRAKKEVDSWPAWKRGEQAAQPQQEQAVPAIPYTGRPLTPLKVVQSPFGPLRHLAKRSDDQRSLITICAPGCDATTWTVLDVPPSMIEHEGAACPWCLRARNGGTR